MSNPRRGYGRIAPFEAAELLSSLGIPRGADYYTLSSSVTDDLVTEAKRLKYRKPQSASGSTGRYFHEYLQRIAKRWLGTGGNLDLGMQEHWAGQAKRYGKKSNPRKVAKRKKASTSTRRSAGSFFLTNGSGKRIGTKRFRTKDSAVSAARNYLLKLGRRIKIKVWKD